MSAKRRKRRALEEAQRRKRRRIFIIAIIALIIAETGYILAVTRFNIAGLFGPAPPVQQTPSYGVGLLRNTRLLDLTSGVVDGAPKPGPNYVMVVAPSIKYVAELGMGNCTQVFSEYVRNFNNTTVYLTVVYPTFAGGSVYPTYNYELLYVAEELVSYGITRYHNVKIVVLNLTDTEAARSFLVELANIVESKLGWREITGETLVNTPWLLVVEENKTKEVKPLFC